MNKWLVMVNAQNYNLLGAARKFGDGIPWCFDGTQGVQTGDKVLFYLTKSNEPNNTNPAIDDLYQRVVFEGTIVETGEKAREQRDRDIEYWDTTQADNYRKYTEIVMIRIDKSLYDEKISSEQISSKYGKEIWKKRSETYVIKLEG